MLKRILLCGARRSASIPNPFLNIFQVHLPTRRSDAKRSFTLAVVILLGVMAWGQESTQGTGCAGSFCTANLSFGGGNGTGSGGNWANPQPISSNIPDSIDSPGNPPIVGTYHPPTMSAGDWLAVGLAMGRTLMGIAQGNAFHNLAHANDSGLYIPVDMMAPIGFAAEEADMAFASGGGRIGGPNGGGWARRATSVLMDKMYYTGDFHTNLSLWEMQDFGSSWGVNANIPGRHLLGELDTIRITQPKYAEAVERAGERFWQKGYAIQNAIAKEPSLMEHFNELAEKDASYRILTKADARAMGASGKTVFRHYQERGLKAFGNP